MRHAHLLTRKSVLIPTLLGWVLLAAFLFLSWWFSIKYLYDFLALNAPVKSKTMVVEGWLPDYALEQSASLFHAKKYTAIITTGAPLSHGSYLKEYASYAELAKASLIEMGIPKMSISALPISKTLRDRTYESAREVSGWLKPQTGITSINLITLGPHARRSYDLYRKALPNNITLGVISIPPKEDYIAERWWTSSAGIKTVLIESIAFFYYNTLWSPETN